MPLGIDPTVDYVFKKLFGDPANSDLLIHVLNAVLDLPQPIVDVTILNPFNEQEFDEDKTSILDLKAKCQEGRWYNVEMQSRAMRSLPARLAYYSASLYVDQMGAGDGYATLKPAFTICFLNNVQFRGVREPHLRFLLCDARHRQILTDLLQVHTIELPKYNFGKVGLPEADDLSQWAFFLSRAAKLEADELKRLLPEPEFIKATGVVEMIAKTPEERMRYESRLKAERDVRAYIQDAEEIGEAIGLEKGQKQMLIQQIQIFEQLLQEPVTPLEELAANEVAALQKRHDELLARIAARL
jgi:predicted transposase/invertase (TIGR01784 family)